MNKRKLIGSNIKSKIIYYLRIRLIRERLPKVLKFMYFFNILFDIYISIFNFSYIMLYNHIVLIISTLLESLNIIVNKFILNNVSFKENLLYNNKIIYLKYDKFTYKT